MPLITTELQIGWRPHCTCSILHCHLSCCDGGGSTQRFPQEICGYRKRPVQVLHRDGNRDVRQGSRILLGRFRKQTVVGVDIAADALRVLALGRQGSSWRVDCHARCALPPGAVSDKRIAAPAQVGQALAELVRQAGLSGCGAVVAVSAAAVITRSLELEAELNDEEMEQLILADAGRQLPYPLEEVAFDFARQGPSRRQPGRQEVLLVACRKEHVERRVAALAAAELRLLGVDVEVHAMERAFALLCRQQLDGSGIVAIMDLGPGLCTLHVLHAGSSIHTRELALETPASMPGWPGLPAARDPLPEQLLQALQFFFSSSQYHQVDLLLLAGAWASREGLAASLQAQLTCPVRLADPLAGLSLAAGIDAVGLRAEAPALMLACGLALWSQER